MLDIVRIPERYWKEIKENTSEKETNIVSKGGVMLGTVEPENTLKLDNKIDFETGSNSGQLEQGKATEKSDAEVETKTYSQKIETYGRQVRSRGQEWGFVGYHVINREVSPELFDRLSLGSSYNPEFERGHIFYNLSRDNFLTINQDKERIELETYQMEHENSN